MRSVQQRDLGKGDNAATVVVLEAVALAYRDPPFVYSPFEYGSLIPCLVAKWLGTAHPEELEVDLGKLVG